MSKSLTFKFKKPAGSKQTQITIPSTKDDEDKKWGQIIKEKKLSDIERIKKHHKKAEERIKEDIEIKEGITLVGPISAYYFENLKLPDGSTKNIFLLGDLHQHDKYEHLKVAEHCCMKTENIKEKYEQLTVLIYVIVGIYEIFKLAKITDETEMLDALLYIKGRAKKIKNIFKNINPQCMSIIDYLYLSGNNKKHECVDVFDESWKKIYNEPRFTSDKGHLGMTRILFKLCRVGLCSQLFNSIRFHYTNIRVYMNDPHLEQKLQSVKPHIIPEHITSILKTNPFFLGKTKEKIEFIMHAEKSDSYYTFLALMYLQYLFGDSKYYKEVYLNKMDDQSLKYSLAIDDLIRKQFKKSIFYTDANGFIHAITHIILNECLISDFNVFEMLETQRMNIYQICRMFIRKDEWKKRDEAYNFRPTEYCQNVTYPKNIISYTGDLHTLFFKNFILHYFPDSKNNLKINKKPRYSRCLKLEYLPFI